MTGRSFLHDPQQRVQEVAAELHFEGRCGSRHNRDHGHRSGDFHVGTISLMPSDNVQGFRPDTIALLRDLHAGMWRLPGGNFISDWDWHNSVGDIDKRPPVFDSRMECDADERRGHGRVDDPMQAHWCRSIHHRQRWVRRRAFCRARSRIHERRDAHTDGERCARRTDILSLTT